MQQRVAQEIEAYEEQQRGPCGLERLYLSPLVAHGDEDGYGARDVDNGEHHKEGAENLFEVYDLEHE